MSSSIKNLTIERPRQRGLILILSIFFQFKKAYPFEPTENVIIKPLVKGNVKLMNFPLPITAFVLVGISPLLFSLSIQLY